MFTEHGGGRAVLKLRAVSRGEAFRGAEIQCDLTGSGPSTGHTWREEERAGNRRMLREAEGRAGQGRARRLAGGLRMLKGSPRGFSWGATGSSLGKLTPRDDGRWVKRPQGRNSQILNQV